MINVEVRAIDAWSTRPLRQKVLRPHQHVEELGFSGDDDPEAGHFGAFRHGELVGVASICPEAPPTAVPLPVAFASPWRLRGMATLPQVRGQGFGQRLLHACLDHARSHGADIAWCNARTPAAGFYRKMGFVTHGAEFVIPDIGPHYVMWLRVG